MQITRKQRSKSSRVTSATNTSGIVDKTEPIVAYDDWEDGTGDWEEIDSKAVKDSDGFWTDYTMWYNTSTGQYVFIFGDSDLYYPENADWDWECESEAEAEEWFVNYEGFGDEDDIWSCRTILSASDSAVCQDATDVVLEMNRRFPELDFTDERDRGDDVLLHFLYTPKFDGNREGDLVDFLDSLGFKYRIRDGNLWITAPESSDYLGDDSDDVQTCREVTASEQAENLIPFVVRYGWDAGGPESGPSYGYGEDIVYAISEDDACSKWESENQDLIQNMNAGKYGGYEGCFARPATDSDIAQMEEEQKFWDEMEKHYTFDDDGVHPIDGCDSIKSSEEFYDMGTGLEYWYFTKHGVQPGSVPKGLEILDIIDKPEGTYFLTNRVISTDALKYYDIKEKSPK